MSTGASVRLLRAGMLLVLACLAVAALAAAPAASASPHRLRLGYGDPIFKSTNSAFRERWLGRASQSGASMARINVRWSGIAPAPLPAGFEATNPASPGYRWSALDAAVRGAEAHGLEVMFTILEAPTWAEGPNRPSEAKQGSWEPQPEALGAFAVALARRYDGSFPDPSNPGTSLPRVRYFDAWNEPNLANFLSPQVTSSGKLVGPELFRKMLNSFYAGIKEAQPHAVVIAPSSASFGAPNGFSTAPVLFLRDLLCLRGGRLRQVSCPEKAHMDELGAHAIQVGPPTESAVSPLDATTPDLGRLTRVVRAAERAGTVESRGRIGLWVTEFWVISKPPNPGGIPLMEQARWYDQNLYEYWQAGAEVALELQLRDGRLPTADNPLAVQTGVFFRSGKPKPSYRAMRFPLVAHHVRGARVKVWGIAPRAGRVRIQALSRGTWRTLGTVRAAGVSHPFTATVPWSGAGRFRARLGRERSLAWKLG